MCANRQTKMARTRALLTKRDRELLADEEGGNRRYQAISEIRSRINEELETDVKVLAEHHPDLLSELREEVCERPHLAQGIQAYVAVKQHPETEQDEILFDGEPIKHVAYDETSSDTLKWGYSGAGPTNTARSILEHAVEELGCGDIAIEHNDQVNFRQEFIQQQSGSGWAIPLSSVEKWIRNHLD